MPLKSVHRLSRLGAVALLCGMGSVVAAAQGAGGGGSSTGATGGATGSGTANGTQIQGSGDRKTDAQDGAGTSQKGVAGTGMGATTPAMRANTSSTGGNGESVQRPDPGASDQGAAKP